MLSRPPRLEQAFWAVAILTAVVGIFVLPWYLANTTPVPGESYVLGFNNRVGILSLAAALAAALAARLVSVRPQTGIEWIAAHPVLLPPWTTGRLEYFVLGGWCVLWINILWGWGSSLVDPAWCESRGFYHGLDMMALGSVPYRDFMFNYGPSTLYVPHWLSTWTGGDLSVEHAYLVTLVLFTVLGFVCLFVCLRALAIPRRLRTLVLLLAVLAWGEVNMGLNGVPLRFFVVPASLVAVHGFVWNRGLSDTRRAGRMLIAAVAAGFACFAVSPEMGIAVTVALVAMGLCPMLAGERATAITCWGGSLAALGITAVVIPDYFLSVFAFASGGHNFPIYPNLHNVALVGLSLFVIPAILASAARSPGDVRAPLAASLAVAGGILLPAAFGRCDPGHVFHDGILPLMLVFPAAIRWPKPWRMIAVAAYVVLYIVLLQVSYWSYYANNFTIAMQMRAAYEQNPQMVDTWREKWDALRARHPRGKDLHWSSVLPYPEELDDFTRQGPMLLLAGNEWNYWLARYLMLQQDLPPDYYHAYTQGAATPAQIDRKVREARGARFLIVPEFVLSPLQGPIDLVAYGKSLDRFLSGLLFFPVRSRVKNPPYLPDSEIAKRVLEDFKPIHKYQGYVVLEKKRLDERKEDDRTTSPQADGRRVGDEERAP